MNLNCRYIFTRKPGQEPIKVSPSDYDMLIPYTWSLANGYAITNVLRADNPGKRTTLYMHRLIANTPANMETDNIGGRETKLDNRRENLRTCTDSENQCNRGMQANNSSGYKGVTWNKTAKKWMAKIRVNRNYKYLGLYDVPEEAHKAYVEAADRYHGEFARAA